MRKILMRGGMTPLDNLTPEVVIANNSIGANSGNLLYAYGVYRTLMTEDTVIDMDYYGVERSYTDADIARINEEYDAYVCPLADAFRDAFTEKLEKYANFFNKLTIPCYVIGVGLRAPYEPEIGTPRVFDEAAKKFVKAALDKSSIIGLRGEITGEYLKTLGFREDVDYMPIGCPSMYALGRELPQRPLQLSESSKIAFNLSSITPENIMRFAFNEMQVYKDHYLIEQNRDELRLLYYGDQYRPRKTASPLLPRKLSNPLLREDRYHIFINVPTWLEFLRGMDLSIGSKLHGNVAGIMAGCPTLFMPLDSRMRELVAYHDFPSIPYMDVREDDRIKELISRVDLTSHLKKQAQNFDRFVGFLDRNGCQHIYSDDITRTTVPLDEKMAQISYHQVVSILYSSPEEILRRIQITTEEKDATISKLKKKVSSMASLEEIVAEKAAAIESLEVQLSEQEAVKASVKEKVLLIKALRAELASQKQEIEDQQKEIVDKNAILDRPGVQFALRMLEKYPKLENWLKNKL